MKLTDFELEVMGYFWQSGELSSAEIHKAVTQKRDVAYTTAKTIIDRLEQKGAVVRSGCKKGRALVYRPAVTSEEISSSWIPEYLERFYGGNPSRLITQLISEKKLSDEERQEIRQLLERNETREEVELEGA